MAAQRLAKSAHPPPPAHLYRYRTKALVGPWRQNRAQAMADALHAGQARSDECDRESLLWRVEGRIEERIPKPRAAAEGRRVGSPSSA
ncbi:MAG: hypothetical protein QOD42_358 [Sphingomonadales bacterium]|jgi:hypothetical protein|nr:hypothetical protein [Sphingomonadales bacterium]